MDPYIATISTFGFNYPPRGWSICDGALVPIGQNEALFSIIGTIYGGDGQATFALPNLSGRAPMHWGDGQGLTPRVIGEKLGSETVTLTVDELPPHTHMIEAAQPTDQSQATDTPTTSTFLGVSLPGLLYSDTAAAPNAILSGKAIGETGGSLPHQNMQPYQAIFYAIALIGIYPTRS